MGLDFDLSRREGSPGFLLTHTGSLMKLGLLHAFQQIGFNITHEHWAILRTLWNENGLSQNQLAERTKKDRPNISRIVDVLVKNGYVQRTTDPRDRRIHLIMLTDEGESIEDQLTPVALEFMETAFSGVSKEEYHVFSKVIDKVIQNLDTPDSI